MTCCYCGKDKKLVKAHIIPEGFFRRMREGVRGPLLVKQREHIKRSPIGIYDSSILCADCESIFGTWDDYAQRILVTDLKDAEPITDGMQIGGWVIRNYRYDLLKLFFISLLWRAGVSAIPFYRRIKLGQFESAAKRLVGANDPGNPEDFAVVLARFIDAPSGGVILDPHPDRLDGVKYCRFYLGKYVAYIKTDTRTSPGDWGQFAMKPGQPLTMIRRDLQQSTELPLMREIVSGVKRRGKV